jgi:hypothetical protein
MGIFGHLNSKQLIGRKNRMVISIKDEFIWEFLVTNINVFDNCKSPLYFRYFKYGFNGRGRVYMYRVIRGWL